MGYSVIYADPPWTYSTKECLTPDSILNGELNTHYDTMKLQDVYDLPVKALAEKDCILFLWVVSPMLEDGFKCLKAWGFKYSTIGFVWEKQRTNPGHYTLSSCEICLVARRGNIPKPRGSRNTRQFLSELRRDHSQKPDTLRDRIADMFPEQKKIELFGRERFHGWDCYGNEGMENIILDGSSWWNTDTGEEMS